MSQLNAKKEAKLGSAIHNQGNIICFGTFRMSHVESLYVDADLSLLYAFKTISLYQNILHIMHFLLTNMKLPDLLLKPWNKLKILLHPNILFLHTHFQVSMLYKNYMKLEHLLV